MFCVCFVFFFMSDNIILRISFLAISKLKCGGKRVKASFRDTFLSSWHSCPFLYFTLWEKLWHFVQLKCLFETLAKKLCLSFTLIILLRCVK